MLQTFKETPSVMFTFMWLNFQLPVEHALPVRILRFHVIHVTTASKEIIKSSLFRWLNLGPPILSFWQFIVVHPNHFGYDINLRASNATVYEIDTMFGI